ncbi:MAG TPA: TetR/AcrR family transcriptional regulator [Sphingobacteriaceae bacterium]|nr:TetR/AcrR family transcriptional regulator [Sphingobacteriaceae bacterium]
MARTKEFDPEKALDAAMELFWRQGYTATSMADLTEHMGIAKASLYATFGSKHDLYVKALRRYLQTRDPSPIALLSRPGPVLPAVAALVNQYAEESACDPQRRGCLIVNSATELLPGDGAVARIVESALDSLEVALTAALTRAQAQGELPADKDPQALARFIVVVLQGIRVLGRTHPHPERLRDAARQALQVLEA